MKRQASLLLKGKLSTLLFSALLLMAASSCSRKTMGSAAGKMQDVFNKDYIKETMVKVTTWQLNHPKHAPTDWTNGAFYAGVVAAYNTTGAKMILDGPWRAHRMATRPAV